MACKEPESTYHPEESWGLDKQNPRMTANVNSLQGGELIFSEIMVDNAGLYDFRGEWIELYNTTDYPISLKNMNIESLVGHGSFTVEEQIVVEPKDYIVFAHRLLPHMNGALPQVDYLFNYLELKLTNIEHLILTNNHSIIDEVQIDKSWAHIPGHALALDYSVLMGYEDRAENVRDSWHHSTTEYGNKGEYGTPGYDNEDTLNHYDLQEDDLLITEVMVEPIQEYDWGHEWFEIYNNTEGLIYLYDLGFKSSDNEGWTNYDRIYLEPSEYMIFGTSYYNEGITLDIKYNYNKLSMFEDDDLSIVSGDFDIDFVEWGEVERGSTIIFNEEGVCFSSYDYGDGNLGSPSEQNESCE